jgi:hypothetical protein
MNRAFDSPTHSDLTIVVDDTRFHVHKVILGLRTPFFTNATRHGFSEANDNVVTIREHGVEAVRSLLKYCYTGEYGEMPMIGLFDANPRNKQVCSCRYRVYANEILG